MFCTVCAAANSFVAGRCAACGAVLTAERDGCDERRSRLRQRRPSSPPTQSRSQSLAARLLTLVPLMVLLIAGGGLGVRYRAEHDALAAAYQRGERALASGDVDAAISAFALAGTYRDAESRRNAIQQEIAPLREAYFDGAAALDAGRYDDAIVDLLSVARAMPAYENVQALLDEARHQRASDRSRAAEAAIARDDWLTADRMLATMLADDPQDTALADRLAALRLAHAPIVFTRDMVLYVSGPDLNDERQISDDVPASAPTWSPDRSQIAFFSPEPDSVGQAKLYVVNPDGSGLRQLAEDALIDWWPAWSPDGTKIAFTSVESFTVDDQRGYASIHVVDLATGTESNLTGSRYTSAASVTWAPDGQRIAFISRQVYNSIGIGNVRASQEEVVIGDLVSGTFTPVSGNGLPGASRVNWSPADGSLVVLTRQGDPSAYGGQQVTALYLIDLSTGAIEALTPRTEDVGPAYWSPDGTRFAYVMGSVNRDSSVVRVRSVDGLQDLEIGMDRPISLMLTWAVDGQALIALTSDPGSGSALIPLGDGAGTPVDLPIVFDLMPNLGPLQWSSVTPARAAPPPSLGGTARDASAG